MKHTLLTIFILASLTVFSQEDNKPRQAQLKTLEIEQSQVTDLVDTVDMLKDLITEIN